MKELTTLEFNNQRIMTTKVLAEVYGTEDKIISNNFNRNIERFVQGKHYYKLEGKELKEFKTNHLNDEPSLLRVNCLYLWTEKGALRHAKILDTDVAWEVYEKLEDTYFKVNTLEGSNAYRNEIETVKCEIGLIDMVSNTLKLNDNSKLQLITKSFENHNINTNLLPVYASSKGVLKCATELLKEYNSNLSVIKFNKKLVELGILKECTRQSTKDKNKVKKFKNLVDTTWGENEINPKNSKETQPLYYENKFKELLEMVQA